MDYIFTGVFTFEMVIKVRCVVALGTPLAPPPLGPRRDKACLLLGMRVLMRGCAHTCGDVSSHGPTRVRCALEMRGQFTRDSVSALGELTNAVPGLLHISD